MTGKIVNPAQDHPQSVSRTKLWFGFGGAGIAWATLGVADLLIAWWFCGHRENAGRTGAFVIVALTVLLLATAMGAGWTGYVTWRNASRTRLGRSEAVGRQEFMGMVGLLMAISLGVGIVWLGLAAAIVDLCTRAR